MCCLGGNSDLFVDYINRLIALSWPQKIFCMQKSEALVETQPEQKVRGIFVRLSAVSTEAQKAILYFIHIHQVYYETHFFTNLKKKKEILACYFCLFLSQAK